MAFAAHETANLAARLVPGTGIEPVRPFFRKAADFKSAVSTSFTTRAAVQRAILSATHLWEMLHEPAAIVLQGSPRLQVVLR